MNNNEKRLIRANDTLTPAERANNDILKGRINALKAVNKLWTRRLESVFKRFDTEQQKAINTKYTENSQCMQGEILFMFERGFEAGLFYGTALQDAACPQVVTVPAAVLLTAYIKGMQQGIENLAEELELELETRSSAPGYDMTRTATGPAQPPQPSHKTVDGPTDSSGDAQSP